MSSQHPLFIPSLWARQIAEKLQGKSVFDEAPEDPKKRWLRATQPFNQSLEGPPREIWPMLDLVKPELLFDSIRDCFVVRLIYGDPRMVSTTMISRRATIDTWKRVIGGLCAQRTAHMHPGKVA